MTKRFGFTLAEVLITLTIIGVIAAMTIPTLMTNTSDQEFKTGFKKALSTLNQAITLSYALDGNDVSDFTTKTAMDGDGIIAKLFRNRMQVITSTDARGTAGNGASNSAFYLADGMAIEMNGTLTSSKSAGCEADPACLFSMLVDVNGDKGTCAAASAEGTTVAVKDCWVVDVYADGIRPGNEAAKLVMYSGK